MNHFIYKESLPARAKRLGVIDIEYVVVPGTERVPEMVSRVAGDDSNLDNIHTTEEFLERIKKGGSTPFDYAQFLKIFR